MVLEHVRPIVHSGSTQASPWEDASCIGEGLLGHDESRSGGCSVQLQLVGLGLGVPGDREAISRACIYSLEETNRSRF